VEHHETPLCVEELLDIDKVRFGDLLLGITGFHVRGTE
jgi:hypothetical protein